MTWLTNMPRPLFALIRIDFFEEAGIPTAAAITFFVDSHPILEFTADMT